MMNNDVLPCNVRGALWSFSRLMMRALQSGIALLRGRDITGLCTVRDCCDYLLSQDGPYTTELVYRENDKTVNVEIRVTSVRYYPTPEINHLVVGKGAIYSDPLNQRSTTPSG